MKKVEFDPNTDSWTFLVATPKDLDSVGGDPFKEPLSSSQRTDPWFSLRNWKIFSDSYVKEIPHGISHDDGLPR
jgi:hypothetical protein